MRVSFQHANPHDGRESYLVRIQEEIHDQTTCILVDAGSGVDVDGLLGADEYLSAVLLTHAHLDHYRTLGSNLRDGAPIYATPETADAITTRLDTDAEHVDLDNSDDVREAIEPITDWTTITSDVRVHPVPAGHAPGACGFVVQFADGHDRHHLLATGDFTTRRAAGYPGLATDLPVDAVFLTAATRSNFRERLTDAVGTIVDRATAGSTVLTTASGSTGVHLAYLLAHVGTCSDPPLSVRVVGRVATLWDTFEFDHPAVESVPTFATPSEVLDPGYVTIAGPEVPVAGSSERLFETIEHDAGATLVQVTSGALDPERSAGCTVDHYELSNHPTEETIDAVVEELGPIHVVVTHQQGQAADRYKDKYDSFVWATDDYEQYVLYDDGWSGPPWVTEATRRRVRSRLYRNSGSNVRSSVDTTDVPLPAVERCDDVDLDAEGIDTERLASDIGVDLATPAADRHGRSDYKIAATDGSLEREPIEREDAIVESDDEGCPGDAVAPDLDRDTGSLEDIIDRLDRIEDAVTGDRTKATVVDAGDDVTLLRLVDDPISEDLAHGQLVDLVLRKVGEPDATADAGSDTGGGDKPE